MKHIDFVKNDWHNVEQRLLGTVTADVPNREDLEDSFLGEIVKKWGEGAYFFCTAPHSPEDCPFNEGEIVKMRRMDV